MNADDSCELPKKWTRELKESHFYTPEECKSPCKTKCGNAPDKCEREKEEPGDVICECCE